MNKLLTKIVGATLGLTMAIGVGVAVANASRDVAPAQAAASTYHHTFNAKPNTGNGVTLSSVNWNITATELGSYNSANYAGVQIGTKKANGEISLTSSSAWGSQSGTYKDKTVISEIRVWMNKGGGTTAATVTIGGTAAISDGTVVAKNSSAASYSDTTCVTFTPAEDHDTGVVVITVNASGGAAGYICAMEIDCDEPAGPSEDPAFTIDKNSVSLTLDGSSTTVTATPNEYVSGSATYAWSRTAGDDCVTLTNANTATVTIAPKGTAVSASCTLTIAVTGCTSKTVSVTVKKVSSQSSPFSVADAIDLVDAGVAADMADVYVHGFISQVDSYNSTYHSITYWISDDGTTTDQFEVYSGKGLGNTDFSSVADLEVGYEVTVFGTVKEYNGTKEFDKNNYIVSLVRPSTFEVTTSTSGLTLSTDEVGTTGSVTLTTAAKKKGTNVIVTCGTGTATVNGNVVTLSDVDDDVEINATIVDAEVASIALSGYPTKLALNGDFSSTGLVVTGTYDDWVSPHTSETIASGYTVNSSAVNMNVEGTYNVTVTYGSANASYQVTVTDIFDNTKGEYHKVTDLSQLYDGAHVAIVDAGEEYSMLSGFTSTSNVTATSVTADATTSTISKANVLDIELVKTAANEYRFKLDDDLYLYASSSSSNQLKASTLATSGNNGKFLIALSAGTFTVTAQGTSSRNTIRFNPNNGSPLFNCYASSSTTGSTVAFYVFQTYTAEANAYAETFIKGNGSANTCAATIDNWATLGTAFGKLTDGAKSIFEEATHNAPETYTTSNEYTVEHAVARYDDALLKHTELRSNEFMGRVSAGTLSYSANVANPVSVKTSQITIIVVIASVVSIASVGAYFLLRKRKEH